MLLRGRTVTESIEPTHFADMGGENLVADARSGLSPAQMVQDKLVSLLRSTPLSMNRLQSVGPLRSLSFPERGTVTDPTN